MKYTAEINFNSENPDKVIKIIESEQGKKDRSEIRIEKKKTNINFHVQSKDAVAFKASINTIIKILTIIEKTETLVKNG